MSTELDENVEIDLIDSVCYPLCLLLLSPLHRQIRSQVDDSLEIQIDQNIRSKTKHNNIRLYLGGSVE